MRYLPLIACALSFALPASAQKFWLSDPEARKNAPEASAPDLVSGVLVSEDADGYHIRVVGGEIVLPKKVVFKVEKDDALTLDAITKSEKDAAEAVALANKERELQQQIAKKEREMKAVEAAARRSASKPADAPASKGVAVTEAFDPVVGVALVSRGDLVREMQVAYEATRDRDYLRALRQLRRLR
jgi:hypothetical protein